MVGRAAPPPSTRAAAHAQRPGRRRGDPDLNRTTAALGTANGLQVISVVAGSPAAEAARHRNGALVDVFVIPRELAD
ncbi:hypothetical protein [Mycobacterium sp.]|uniref:hypothetical protein n=1 Tax=Mycobacterium sp. TaxID=1785 RepID=UPI003F980BEB